jgi:hypothetical protein
LMTELNEEFSQISQWSLKLSKYFWRWIVTAKNIFDRSMEF